MLEAAQYDDNTFATLTYSDENLPADNSVDPKALRNFFKRLRKKSALKIRYFACGEYGEHSMRPHYHIALFGYPNCGYINTRHRKERGCCPQCDLIAQAWGLGQIQLGTLEQKSAAYIAGYVVKKMTKDDDPRLEGRLPEFARMSLRPGLGLGMMHELASTLMEHRLDERMIDVPLSLQHGTKKLPLGRYLRRKLRLFIGRSEKTPLAAIELQREELRDVRQAAFDTSTSFAKAVERLNAPKARKIETRNAIFKKRGSI